MVLKIIISSPNLFQIDPEFSNRPKDILNRPKMVLKQAQNYSNRPTFIFK